MGHGPLVGMVGRINPRKGHLVFLEAARILATEFSDIRFVVVGGALPVYEPLRRELLDMAAAPPLAGRVVFTGELSRQAVADVVQTFSVLAVPTVDMEPLGLVALEAMALGVPVVATHGGPDDVVIEGVTGYLVPPGDPVSLAQALRQALANPELGRAGQARVSHDFYLPEYVRQMEGLYEEVLRK